MTAIPSTDGNLAFVQVGLTALRGEDGQFLPVLPLFVAVNREELNPSTGMAQSEAELCENIGQVLASKYQQYISGLRALEHLKE